MSEGQAGSGEALMDYIEAAHGIIWDMVDIAENIGFLVREERRKRRVSARQVGREIGITSATFTRLEKGHSINVNTLVALLRWLGGEKP